MNPEGMTVSERPEEKTRKRRTLRTVSVDNDDDEKRRTAD